MKMKYERPVMRAQVFQANAYCAGCDRVLGTTSSVLKVIWDDKYYYFDPNAVAMRNPNNGNTQYYFNEHKDYMNSSSHDGNTLGNADGVFYLEFSNSYINSRDAHYLYKEDSRSGYGASELHQSGLLNRWNPTDDAVTNPGSGAGLQVNDGSDGWGISWWGDRSDPNAWWYSDDLQGKVTYSSDTVMEYIMSY